MTTRRCNQTKCCFLGTALCPQCSECHCKPNIVDNDCVRCWNCENDFGELRGKVNLKGLEDSKVLIKEREIIL